MRGKILLNTAYTIGIFLCFVTLMWGFEHKRYEFVGGAVLIGGMFIYLKIKLAKEVRELLKNRKP